MPQQKPQPGVLETNTSLLQSQAGLAALAAKDEYELMMAGAEAKEPAARVEEVAKKRKLSEGKKFLGLVPQRSESRQQKKQRVDLTAFRKNLVVKALEEAKPQYSTPEDYRQAMSKQRNLRKDQLQRLLRNKDKYNTLSKSPLENRSSKNHARKRASVCSQED